MFSELAKLAKITSIHVVVTTAPDNKIKVVVLPQAREGVSVALCQPLSLIGTPRELDEKFIGLLSEYISSRESLEEI